MTYWPYFNQPSSPTELLVGLINDSNPGLNWSPVTLDSFRLGTPEATVVNPETLTDTVIELYPLESSSYIGKTKVYYRRIDLDVFFKHHDVEFDRWRSNRATFSEVVTWINRRYGTLLSPTELGTSTTGASGVITLTVQPDSYCYQGRFSVSWLPGKRDLDQILDLTKDQYSRVWDQRHSGSSDPRPLLTLVGYGGDYTSFEATVDQLPTTTVINERNAGTFLTVLNRHELMYGTGLSVALDHTVVGGISGLELTKHTLPDGALPEANAKDYRKALALTSKADSWFGGRVLFHYDRRPVVTSSFGPGVLDPTHGTHMDGFFGEVPSEAFIAPPELLARLGLPYTPYTSRIDWLKFTVGEQVLMIPKTPLAYGMSWSELYGAGLVYGNEDIDNPSRPGRPVQNRHIEIGGALYRIRLMRGGDTDPSVRHGGEWDVTVGQVGSDARWSEYTAQELGWVNHGRYTWCMESDANGTHAVLRHPSSGAESGYVRYPKDLKDDKHGWRPVLELVTVQEAVKAPTLFTVTDVDPITIKPPALSGRADPGLTTDIRLNYSVIPEVLKPISITQTTVDGFLKPVVAIRYTVNALKPPVITGFTYIDTEEVP